MLGMNMMLKELLGFDPDELKAQFETSAQAIVTGVQKIGERLNSIDARLLRIEQTLNISQPGAVPLIEYQQGEKAA